MERQLIQYLKALRQFPSLSLEQRQRYLLRPLQDFTRSSPLSFHRTVNLLLGLMRKSMAIELFDFFSFCQQRTVTKSALSQRRKLIRPLFFKEFFQHSVQQFYHRFRNYRTWRNLRVFAVDGTGQTLPKEHWIGQAFGWHKNQFVAVPSVRLLITFDVLNKMIYRVDFYTQQQAEVRCAYPNVEQLPHKAVYIYDRAYAGYGLPFLHQRHGSFYLIRMKSKDSPDIVDFIKSKDNERFISIALRDRAYRSLRDLGLNPTWNAQLMARLIRVELPTGEVEVLMTNLMHRRRFHYRRIAQLYTKRWGVETAIFNLKSLLQLALVSAYTQPGVEQDLWASFWFYNLNSAFEFAQHIAIKKRTQNRYYFYQLNRNMAAGLIKRWIPSLFLESTRKWRARTAVLKECLLAHLEPYRQRPSRARNRKILRGQGRHIYEPNYRSTM